MSESPQAGLHRWLSVFALAYGLLHHQGFVLGRLGELGDTGTRWADWFDMATPYLVLIPAGLVLVAAGAGRRLWILFAVGALTYVEGHGIHLSANSINNGAEGSGNEETLVDLIEFWDEIVGHYLWYGGFTLVSVVVAVSTAQCRRLAGRRGQAVGLVLAIVVGVTYTTNSLEGHFAVPGLIAALAVAVWGYGGRWQRGTNQKVGLGRDLSCLTFGTAFLLLGFYGIWHRGFPDPTSVGWNVLAP